MSSAALRNAIENLYGKKLQGQKGGTYSLI